MIGWRARLGFLVPPGNPTVEPEMMALAPPGVSVHFHRMTAKGEGGSPEGQAERNRMMLEHLEESASLLAMVEPTVIAVAHTATSYALGREGEARLLARLEGTTGTRVLTAFGAIAAALGRLGVKRLAYGTPYSVETTRQGRAHLEAHGFEIVRCERMPGVGNIYVETPERAYQLARMVDAPEAEAVLLSGTGLPTLPVLAALEADLKKPVLSSNAAMMWHALRLAGIGEAISGYGRLLALD
jgi:maleate cis-trans isomerase